VSDPAATTDHAPWQLLIERRNQAPNGSTMVVAMASDPGSPEENTNAKKITGNSGSRTLYRITGTATGPGVEEQFEDVRPAPVPERGQLHLHGHLRRRHNRGGSVPSCEGRLSESRVVEWRVIAEVGDGNLRASRGPDLLLDVEPSARGIGPALPAGGGLQEPLLVNAPVVVVREVVGAVHGVECECHLESVP
jgi:hypothetical protein